MGCINSSSAGGSGAKTTVWDCQYCGSRFGTYNEAEAHEQNQCLRRPGAPQPGVAPVAGYQPGQPPGGYKPGGPPQQGGYKPGGPPQAAAGPVHLRCGNCQQVFGAPPGFAQCKCPKCGMINAVPVTGGPGNHMIPQNLYDQKIGTTPGAMNQAAPTATGKRKGLFVGCNYPGTRAELRGCINDVQKMKGLVCQMYGFPAGSACCRVLTDDNRGDGMPTRQNILAGLRWLVEGAQPGDCFFFHFSGHGAQQEDPKCMEEDGYDETICPTDFDRAGMIVDDEIFDIIVAPLPSGAKLTAVMDCCHSGTGMDLPFTYQGGRFVEEDNPAHSQGDVVMISGCEDHQTSSDGGGGYGAPLGAMTQALTKTLERNRNLSFAQLHSELQNELSRGGFSQRPSITSSQNFDANQRMFNMNDGFVPNSNAEIGRLMRKKKHPKNPSLMHGGLGEMLMAGAVGFMVVDALGSDVGVGLMMGGAAMAGGALMDSGGGGGFLGALAGGLLGGGDGGGGFFLVVVTMVAAGMVTEVRRAGVSLQTRSKQTTELTYT